MCGIFGLVCRQESSLRPDEIGKLIHQLYTWSESRGKEAAGLALGHNGRLAILKRPLRGKAFIRLPAFRSLLRDLSDSLEQDRRFVLMGHTRMVTNGHQHDHGNNQPVLRGDLACIHNGIIVNDAALWARYPEMDRVHEVDTEVFLALVERSVSKGDELAPAVRERVRELVGANSFALVDRRFDGILLATTNGSLFVAQPEAGDFSLFASEQFILERVIEASGLQDRIGPIAIRQVHAGHGRVLSANSADDQAFTLDGPLVNFAPLPRVERTLTDLGPDSALQPAAPAAPNLAQLGEITRRSRIDLGAVKALRRCSCCLLPETFPFIRFDADGVCNFCLTYRPVERRGRAALEKVLCASESTRSRPTCLAPISGGRDSCYALHYLVKEFGMTPVAYTYDWGMVTDLARRNISRMCGALGVEHILISADIRRKREYVGMNVSAWLKRPRLGTIPLFMAGDKQFFYYADQLKRQMNLDTILFSMNPLERTDFKMGFCGIDESYEKARHYDPTVLNKIRLAAFYGREFALNPDYLNASLLDSMFAFFSYYMLPKQFYSFFDFIPWVEKNIESTLVGSYDWELSPDTKSTWRIGDGTAAFYNYIYLKVAGFTENDTFRSNQIREGLIDRETALARIEEENQPRVESIAWYCDAIGVDALAALDRINRMERLY